MRYDRHSTCTSLKVADHCSLGIDDAEESRRQRNSVCACVFVCANLSYAVPCAGFSFDRAFRLFFIRLLAMQYAKEEANMELAKMKTSVAKRVNTRGVLLTEEQKEEVRMPAAP